MTVLLLGVVLWLAAYVGTAWFFIGRRQLTIGGIALFAISLIPTIYGRATTPPEWHDYPVMSLYYLPTMLAALFSLMLVITGLIRMVSKALRASTGTR